MLANAVEGLKNLTPQCLVTFLGTFRCRNQQIFKNRRKMYSEILGLAYIYHVTRQVKLHPMVGSDDENKLPPPTAGLNNYYILSIIIQ